jgi:hypothetical protein
MNMYRYSAVLKGWLIYMLSSLFDNFTIYLPKYELFYGVGDLCVEYQEIFYRAKQGSKWSGERKVKQLT